MTPAKSCDTVLVVGAGPSGLVLALTLLKNGVPVRIIDKEPKPRLGQRGAGIMSRSLELYNFLGVHEILEKGHLLCNTRIYEVPIGLEPIATFNMDPKRDPTPSTPFVNALTLGQDKVEGILRTYVAKHGIEVEYGTELRRFEQHFDNVNAHIVKTSGVEETSETVKVPFLVGTDGAKGVVRKQLGLPFVGETRDAKHHFVIGDIALEGLNRNYWHKWGDMTTTLVMLRPTEDEGMFFLLAGGHIDHAKCVADNDELIKMLRAKTGRDELALGRIAWPAEYRYLIPHWCPYTPNIRMVNTFGDGRVFVAGDAAHVHSPFGGQGMNSSIQDSFNLGWKLALVHKGLADPALLATYTEERLPVIAEMLQTTTKLLDGTMVAKGGSMQDTTVWQRGGKYQMLGVNYRWSSIVRDERATPSEWAAEQAPDAYGADTDTGSVVVRAGDRAPDAPDLGDVDGGRPTSLFHIFEPSKHTMLLFASVGSTVAPFLEALKRCPPNTTRSIVIFPRDGSDHPGAVADADRTLVDREGYAYGGYAVLEKKTTVTIIRPDGIIGGIVVSVEGMIQYFKRIFATV